MVSVYLYNLEAMVFNFWGKCQYGIHLRVPCGVSSPTGLSSNLKEIYAFNLHFEVKVKRASPLNDQVVFCCRFQSFFFSGIRYTYRKGLRHTLQ